MRPSKSASKLILDFDGVICDALEECALVTWLGAHPPSPRSAVSSYLPAMPRGFLDRFRKIRAYARVLDHFVVTHHPTAANIDTQAEFERVFDCIADQYVDCFVRAASAARQRCREEEPGFWLDLHTLYAGIPKLLRAHSGQVCVITAKDEGSVRTILERNRLDDTVDEVIGECSQKAEAVRDLCARRGTAPESMTFIDDNLTNVREVAATGARTYWAMWGYHTADDLADAHSDRVRRLELADVLSLVGERQ